MDDEKVEGSFFNKKFYFQVQLLDMSRFYDQNVLIEGEILSFYKEGFYTMERLYNVYSNDIFCVFLKKFTIMYLEIIGEEEQGF